MNRPCRAAFTLIELLLVLAIIAVVSAVTVPDFIRSLRGNQRRSAVQTVVSAGRYARSMAVLAQEPMALVFDIGGSRIRVESRRHPAPADDETNAVPPSAGMPEADGPAAPAGPARPAAHALERRLEQVAIAFVERDGERIEAGAPEVVYRVNGRCTPYRVRLSDDRGWGVTIEVDALATAETSER